MVVRISDKTQNYSKVTKLLVKPKNIWIGIIASVVAVIAALKKLPVIGVVLVSVISCVIFYMLMLS